MPALDRHVEPGNLKDLGDQIAAFSPGEGAAFMMLAPVIAPMFPMAALMFGGLMFLGAMGDNVRDTIDRK